MANDPLVDVHVVRAIDSSGNVHNLLCDANGNLIVTGGGSAAPDQVQLVDGTTTTQKAAVDASGRLSILSIASALPTGTNSIGNIGSVASLTGALPAGTNNIGSVNAFPAGAAAANILVGHIANTSTTAAATLITVPANRTWVGVVSISVDCAIAAASATAGQANGLIATAGTGVTPAAGTIFVVEALVGANAAAGTVGGSAANFGSIPLIVVAPSGNSVTVTFASTHTGTSSRADATASGQLL